MVFGFDFRCFGYNGGMLQLSFDGMCEDTLVGPDNAVDESGFLKT